MAILEQDFSADTPEIENDTAPGTYAELKRLVQEHGLLKRAPLDYFMRISGTYVLFALGLVFFVAMRVFWLQLLDAVFLAFICTQFGFIGHDAGHRQIFNSTRNNDILGMIQGNLLLGFSISWWLDKHNRHHSHPNEIDSDPDIAVPMIAFTTDDAQHKQHIFRWMTKYQAFFFFPLLMFVAVDSQRSSLIFLSQGKGHYRKAEMLLLLMHYIGYFGLIFAVLPFWEGVLFIVVHKAASGLYLGSVFAPNHKGMLITEHGSKMDFLRCQVLTARNVKGNPLTTFWYGGLNYQIEHHLFPTMPRRNLAAGQRLIREFCAAHMISYYETNMFHSYCEILSYLHEVGAPLRVKLA